MCNKLVSIIIPVYNERATFHILIEALLSKPHSYPRQIIIVESNSADGTRHDVLSYQNHPEITVILQDAPHGKGNAVRAGLSAATGDIILIQDADLEYDLNDYEALLKPLFEGTASFVLGARQTNRSFAGQPILAAAMNFGHYFFCGLINVLYGTHLHDPFTMYKVFYRYCLRDIHLHCNHFDFDHELVIKLICAGYTPLEIPVSYRSRPYSQGKKVSLLKEPFRWLWLDFRLWVAHLIHLV